ncbi:ribosomal protein L11 methyltransferase [Granulicatella balaenopterae]|uniref:Ribosomal protein L11 methyltransferase n=1 Tax=Granulicatella balaenopterae TaxID=137733 RepID=A0A1H9K0L8_9LACT|nr:50S ribosomal protein L11 methyltransferase [Granulicatella balaenopterae]SEQ92791.1 ribosomal protein L11 methyltransferase [Granulicatella balaenopterae]
MEWIEVSVVTHSESVEAISELLTNLGSQGVSIEDPADFYQLSQEQLEWLKVNQKQLFSTDDVIIKAYFTDEEYSQDMLSKIKAKIHELKDFGLQLGKEEVHVGKVGQQDWAEAWKSYYFPVRVTRNLTVVPSWLDYTPEQANELLIFLDPGLAFGTGTHPTTQLSLAALEQYVRGGERMLDVGTGSGVLSIAAKLLGVGEITAYDIDEMATRISKENIRLNPSISDITVKENNLLVGVREEADLIVANILAEILMQMPTDAYNNLKEGGHLILSGIIDTKFEDVKALYEDAGFIFKQSMRMKEWNCIIFTKVGEED